MLKSYTRDKKNKVKEVRPIQENERLWFTLKELEEKKYIFPNSNVPSVLEDLLLKEVIELPECKRLEEMGHVDDLNHNHYHLIVNHPVKKCLILKELIVKLVRQWRIHLDLDEVVESNHVMVIFGSFDPVSLHISPNKLWHAPVLLIRAHLVYQLIHVQLVLLDWGSNQQNL